MEEEEDKNIMLTEQQQHLTKLLMMMTSACATPLNRPTWSPIEAGSRRPTRPICPLLKEIHHDSELYHRCIDPTRGGRCLALPAQLPATTLVRANRAHLKRTASEADPVVVRSQLPTSRRER